MAFQEAHETNIKLNTPELKKEAFRQYLEHLSKGKHKKSWYFKHPTICLSWETMEKYIKNEPDIFDSEQIKQAMSAGYQKWEEIVESSAEGKNKDANTASLQMVMRNKFGWDKQDKEVISTTQPLLVQFMKDMKESKND